jgi:hypothetical protein
VHYDALAESLALLGGAPLPSSARLSRRVRHLPLAVDRDDDVAVTMFLRRGVSGAPVIDVHTLELTRGEWRRLGGGSAPGDEVAEVRPRLADLGAPAMSSSGGGTARTPSMLSGWISWAQLRAVEEVSVLRVGTRLIPVPDHGFAVVVWTRRPPGIVALDARGDVIGRIALGRLDQLHGGGLRRTTAAELSRPGPPARPGRRPAEDG